MKKRVPPLTPQQTKHYLLHPEAFNISRLEANEMLQEDGHSIARIPHISNRIRQDEAGKIRLVVSRETDETTGEIKEETVVLGIDISNILPGMMFTSDVYHDYFDYFGELINDPMRGNTSSVRQSLTASPQGEAEDTSSGRSEPPQREAEDTGAKNGIVVPAPGFQERLKEKNKIVVGGVTLVRIPDLTALPGAEGIIRILPPNEKGISQVEYIHDQWYDPVKKQPRNKKTRIGHISPEYPGAMIPNDRYSSQFNIETGIPFSYSTPEQRKRMREMLQEARETAAEIRGKAEEAKRRQEERERLKALYGEGSQDLAEAAGRRLDEYRSKWYDEDPDTCDNADDIPMDDREYADETDENSKSEAETDTGDQMPAEKEGHTTMYSQPGNQREREAVIRHILDATIKSIANQARKHPDALVNVYKTEKINDLLIEIRVRYQGSGYEDLLGLIEEPHEVEENGVKYLTGMTYSDVEVLLNHYATVTSLIRRDGKK